MKAQTESDAPKAKRGPAKNRREGEVQAMLERRVGDVAPVGNLMPLVLAVTLAQGTRCCEYIGQQGQIAEHATGADQ